MRNRNERYNRLRHRMSIALGYLGYWYPGKDDISYSGLILEEINLENAIVLYCEESSIKRKQIGKEFGFFSCCDKETILSLMFEKPL